MIRTRVAVAILLVAAAGCGGISVDRPVVDPAFAKPDESLYGHWLAVNKENGAESHLFIGKHTVENNPKGILEAALIGWEPANKKMFHLPTVYFVAAPIGGSSYVCIFSAEKKEDWPNLEAAGSYRRWQTGTKHECHVLRYSCDGNRIRFWGPKDKNEQVKRLVKEQRLAMSDSTDRLVAAESLAEYLRKTDGTSLFNEEGPAFTKVP